MTCSVTGKSEPPFRDLGAKNREFSDTVQSGVAHLKEVLVLVQRHPQHSRVCTVKTLLHLLRKRPAFAPIQKNCFNCSYKKSGLNLLSELRRPDVPKPMTRIPGFSLPNLDVPLRVPYP